MLWEVEELSIDISAILLLTPGIPVARNDRKSYSSELDVHLVTLQQPMIRRDNERACE